MRHHDVHMTHCFQGEYQHTCKYGEDDTCPAKTLEKKTVSMIEVSEDALDSIKAMAQKLREERDMLLQTVYDASRWTENSSDRRYFLEIIARVEQEHPVLEK